MDIKKQLLTAQHHLKDRQLERAKAACRSILKVMPNNNEAILLLASVHKMQQNFTESRRLLEKLLAITPDHPDANNDFGVLFLEQNDFVSAEKHFRKVIEIDPCHQNALMNLGNIHFQQNRFDSAEGLYRKVLEASPDNTKVLNNLGQLLLKQQRISEWRELMDHIVSLPAPGSSMFVGYLGAKEICQWDITDKIRAVILKFMMTGRASSDEIGAITLAMLSDPGIDNHTLFQIVCKTADGLEKRCHPVFSHYETAFRALQPGRRMRIGYLSGDFYQHVCTNFLSGMVDYYDRNRFEIFCYSNTPLEDDVTRKYKSNVDRFIDIRQLSDRQLATRIHADGIHILVDLSGYTSNTRISLMGYRPAPVQISYLGYPFSTGFHSIDYNITDPYLDGPLNARYHTEIPLRLPKMNVASGALHAEEINPIPAFERYGVVTFGSLINVYKLNPTLILAWSRILEGTPGTRLILNHPKYEPEIIRHNILKEFAKHGIAEKRVRFVWERLTDATHLYYYNDIDIALDVFPMTGGQTTIDAIWMGVPVVTLVGDTQRERISYTVINNITKDAEDIIAFSLEEYIQKAVALANNPSRIMALHQLILEGLSHSVLFDPERFVGQLESIYIEAWNRKFPEHRHDPGAVRDSMEFVSIRGGTQIAVSSRIDDRFAYVLKEQEGWFDPEYDFAMEVVQPCMRVVDIVAEAGVYAVPFAKKMAGDGGRVWAISTDVAHTRRLLNSKDHNHLDSLQVIENAHMGNINLDREMMLHDWSSIDFVRINTGGRDPGVMKKGGKLFAGSSPLVMFGIIDEGIQNLSFIKPFAMQGYAFYRLIPGLNLLIPFDPANELDELDAFSTHLFCCKKDRAEALESHGLLMQSAPLEVSSIEYETDVLLKYLAGRPYAEGLMAHWLNIPSRPKGWETYFQALSLFAASKTGEQTAPYRYTCLQGAFCLLRNLLAEEATVSRVMSMARVLGDLGKRVLAVDTLNHLADFLETGEGDIVMNMDEPFLPLSDELASVNPGERVAEWIYVSILEQREKLRAFSSYYTGKESLETLDNIISFGFPCEEMRRRRDLIRSRYKMEDS